MRIAFISYEYPPETVVGGIGTYTFQVARLLSHHDFDVHIFAGSDIRSCKVAEDGIMLHRVKCTGPYDFQKKVVQIFEKEHSTEPFQLMESPEIHANALEIKSRYPSIPLIVRLHASNYLVESFKKKYTPLKNKLRYVLGAFIRGRWDMGYWRQYDYKKDRDYLFAKMANHISAPTLQMKNWAIKSWRINPDIIEVIENPFIENTVFKKALTNNEEQAIIFYGRLNVLKGLITATKAMKKILKHNPGWKWIVVGDDGTAANGRTYMRDWMKHELKAVMNQVTFYEAVSNEQIPAILKKASIVLVPSLFESYSYVTIEAMCAGKAVVGSRGTGIASLIENDVTGKLANPYKINEWEKVIQQLITDKELRKHLGKAAYNYVEHKHLINREIVEFYKTMMPLTTVN